MHRENELSLDGAQVPEPEIRRALAAPWLITNELRRLLAYPWVRLVFVAAGVEFGRGWRIFGAPIIQRYRGSTIAVGDRVSLRSWRSSNPLAPNHRCVLATRSAGARIRIGNDSGFTGVTMVAAKRIDIGDRVTVGANAIIVDTDFHPLRAEDRLRDFNAGLHRPVVIEDDVFIGMNAVILKGVHIGHGSVIGAGSVVSSDVPANVIVAGNPARVIRAL